MDHFDHETMDVYKLAIEFICLADAVAAALPRGRAYLADQLRRARTSVALNIAEGAGEFAGDEKTRFYRLAKRSATECAAVLDVCRRLGLADERTMDSARVLLLGIVSVELSATRNWGDGWMGSWVCGSEHHPITTPVQETSLLFHNTLFTSDKCSSSETSDYSHTTGGTI